MFKNSNILLSFPIICIFLFSKLQSYLRKVICLCAVINQSMIKVTGSESELILCFITLIFELCLKSRSFLL